MTKQEKIRHDTQEMVRRIVIEQFGQKVSAKKLREVADKVYATMPQESRSKVAA
jgi:uncharacterized protein YneF (UPF0154 family)